MERYQQLAGGSEQLESQLPDSLDEYINAEVVLRTIKDTATAVTWLRSTFLSIRVQSAGHVCCNLLAGQGQPAHKLPCTPDDKPAICPAQLSFASRSACRLRVRVACLGQDCTQQDELRVCFVTLIMRWQFQPAHKLTWHLLHSVAVSLRTMACHPSSGLAQSWSIC